MAVINMTKTCKANGITSFSRTRGGWMKIVEGYDKSQYGGYRFVGSNFVKVGNYDVDLSNGLYLDCSKPVIDGEKTEIMNLFKIEDGNVTLLNTIPKATKGWAYTFEDDVNDYFANEGVTALDVLNVIRDMTCNKDILHEVARELSKDMRDGRCWLNRSHLEAYLQDACIYNGDFELTRDGVKSRAVELFHNDHEADVYFNYNIRNDHQKRSLYAFIKEHPLMEHYKDYQVVFEKIAEDYYLNTDNVEKLRNYNNNEIARRGATHDWGWYFVFGGMYATSKRIYILVPNVAKKTILIQTFELQL